MNASASLASAEPSEVGLSPQRLALVRQVLQSAVDTGMLPGAVWMVSRRGRLACFEAIGEQDPVTHAPMRPDSIFRVYSMTKPIVSLVTMMLAEEGRLQISDPISKYLPMFASPQVAVEHAGRVELVPAQREIMIHDLLRHTSGLTYEFLGESAVQKMYVASNIASIERSNAQLIEELASLPLMYQPGTVWHYSRSTDVLGRLLEVVTGSSLGELLTERVLGPLQMNDTAFHVPEGKHERIAQPFGTDPESGVKVELIDARTRPAMEMGGGGLMSTAPDYARFLALLAGKGKFGALRLISRKTLELMTADHLGGLPITTDLLSPGHGFGLGFAVRTDAGLAPGPGTIGTYHWSGIGGTSFWVDPAEELSAMLLSQAPYQRIHFRQLFRNMIYATIDD